MCKLTAFVITEDGDIDYMGGGKIEMVYQANDWYLEFLNQQVKELHIKRSQWFITSMFRALTGSRHKTRKKQVNGIPPALVTTGRQTYATPIDAPTSKIPAEDVTQAWGWLYNWHQLPLRRNQWWSLAQAMSWESLMWLTSNAVVNMFLYIVLMQRSMNTSQTILTNN